MNLHIAFSGGRTSAYMSERLKEIEHKYDKVVRVFANTGQENEATLQFVKDCDDNLGFNTVWVEAEVNPIPGKGTTHRIVNFETASRDGRPFEDVIKKYGIPNQTWQICSRELKEVTVRSYLRSLGWKRKDYVSAIGIRADEVHRVSANMVKQRVIYPLIEQFPVDKPFILDWWRKQSFDLQLREHQGNCKWCWKKSKRKLLTLAIETPEIFEFPARMEEQYGHVGHEEKPRVFFRNRESTKDILNQSKHQFDMWRESPENYDLFRELIDEPGGCSESCEPFK